MINIMRIMSLIGFGFSGALLYYGIINNSSYHIFIAIACAIMNAINNLSD